MCQIFVNVIIYMDFFLDIKCLYIVLVIVGVGEMVFFIVIYRFIVVQRLQVYIYLMVVDNQYEDFVIQVVGEGYQDDIIFDNIYSVDNGIELDFEEGNMVEDDVVGLLF